MSIGGPCLWVPSLSSPVSSPLSAGLSHLSAVARHGDRFSSAPRTISPLLSLSREREPGASIGLPSNMQRAGFKAENALTPPVPVSTAASRPYSGGEISHERPDMARDEMLPRVKLEIPGGNGANFAIARPRVGAGHFGDSTDALMSVNEKDGHDNDNESTVSPTDEREGTVGPDDSQTSPSLEKKKMKRFRLTHNQTRFLMSEFTRQAHPDAAHRERLSREIPGLTPRQVQVWFQNRRAKLKRLTTNDRERMLKSRALPDDFDTTKVLRTPFEQRSMGQTPIASPQDYGAPNPDFAALRGLRTDFAQRPTEDDYLVSPLSSASTAGTYMSSAGQGRNDGLPSQNMMYGRPSASASMSDLHRTIRSDYSITRSSSMSEPSTQPPSYHHGMQPPTRYGAPGQPGLPYGQQPYGVPQHHGRMMSTYDQHQPFEGSVSPTDSQGAQMPYDMNNLGTQPQSYQSQLAMSTQKDYSGLGLNTHIPPHGRPMSTLQSIPVSASQEYRPYSYGASSIPYTQANNASTLSLPSTFAPSESGTAAQDHMQQNPQTIESLRSKFGNPSFNYAGYIQQ
ncbi:uncharacterized protein N7443_005646 [Penicillium atrosanguineum]|uniref:uncharacterized protein n=1 Tax=Penicillium atrosanguineum TaxID=1132637 RepID=UPI0023A26012|nr:uncharacterized protein N7443_005646 [Penicillium atrosanguineum]KAJ5300644.1 hypothetical protein N7443_005646 [Penicillium atrosanguineum]